MATFTKDDIRRMFREESPADILSHMTMNEGIEYPDACEMIRTALRLDAEAMEEMRDSYDNRC
jgi:hypothetical protein